jgi:hypothetical protein
MDRDHVQRLIANAVKPATVTVKLPVMGETLTLRLPNREQSTRILAGSQGDVDWQARMLTGTLRFAAIDDAGQLLLSSFDEAAQFLSALDDDDAAVVFPALIELFPSEPSGAQDLEAGKAL